MIAVLAAAIAGWGWCRRLDPEATPFESVLVGGALAAVALLALDLVRIPWSGPALIAALVLAALAARQFPLPGWRIHPFHVLTAAIVLWHLAYALRPDLWEWTDWLISRRDFFFIWGYKARLFDAAHGIPWRFLAALPHDFTHPDYPLLVPLLFDIEPTLTRHWQPSTIAFLDTALALGLLSVVYRTLCDDFDPRLAAIATFALSGCALLPWIGFADGPLVAYGGAAALLVRRTLRGRGQSMPLAVFSLAAAAMTKNEGMALVAAVAIALAIERRGLLRRLWPAAAVIAVWLTARAALHLPTDLFTGAVLARVGPNLLAFPAAFADVPTYQPIVWIVSLLAVIPNVRRERFLLTVAGIQLVFYLAAYAITPLDLAGHVNGSWPRLTSHVTILIGYAGATSILSMFKR